MTKVHSCDQALKDCFTAVEDWVFKPYLVQTVSADHLPVLLALPA